MIADIYPRIGTSTLTLLEMTKTRIAAEPYPDNVEAIVRTIKLAGQEKRVTMIQSTPEEISLPEKWASCLWVICCTGHAIRD